MKTLRQIYAIARTEFRFGLRRGGPVVTTLVIWLIFGAGILIGPLADLSPSKETLSQVMQNQTVVERWAEKGFSMDFFRQIYAGSMANMTVLSVPMMSWFELVITSFLLLPTATATSLPADRAFGVVELLHSMPINGGIYLAGKVLGVGVTVALVGLSPLGLIFVVLEWIFLAAFQVGVPAEVFGFFFKFFLLDWLPIVGWALTIGILAGSTFHSRRAAVFPGLVAGILSIFFWLAAFSAPAKQIDVAAYYLLQNYHSVALDTLAKVTGFSTIPLLGEGAPVIGIERVIIMYLIIGVTLFSLAWLVRLWLKWKENF
jgi:hypothetical protein